LAKKLKFM